MVMGLLHCGCGIAVVTVDLRCVLVVGSVGFVDAAAQGMA